MTSDEWHDSQDAQDYGLAILSGDRVRLRELRDGDVDQLVSWWNIPEWAALQQKSVKPRPEQPLKEMFRTWSENKPASADVGFSIVRRVDDVLIGHATLFGATPTVRAAGFAIMLGPDFVGQGLGSEAVRLMVAYGFRELGLNRIGLSVWAYNVRARRSYEKAGFRDEGRRREVTFHAGLFHDEIQMSILASEFVHPVSTVSPAQPGTD